MLYEYVTEEVLALFPKRRMSKTVLWVRLEVVNPVAICLPIEPYVVVNVGAPTVPPKVKYKLVALVAAVGPVLAAASKGTPLPTVTWKTPALPVNIV